MSIYLAAPTYDGHSTHTTAAIALASKNHHILMMGSEVSLLCYNFNQHWCNALNHRRDAEISHFAMIHADIGTAPFWVDTLVAELDDCGADILSVVVPMKNGEGLTSTGVFDPDQPGRIRRVTMRELFDLPETFGIDDVRSLWRMQAAHWKTDANDPLPEFSGSLVVNTGLWVCRMTDVWVEKMHFFTTDRIVKVGNQFVPQVMPEDWNFSTMAARLGLRVMATRKVGADHFGKAKFSNNEPWGSLQTDTHFNERST